METRAALLSDPSHRIVFPYTPKHASWMKPGRDLAQHPRPQAAQRGNFTSVDDLRAKVLAFITCFNRTMAKHFRWTYRGKALAA